MTAMLLSLLQIAIKMLDKQRASREVLAKFLPREISVVRRLNHPSVLRVFRVVETPQELYFMMEMAENGDLLDYINWRGLLPESEARYVLRGVAAGVAHCHGRDIVHRDLKCENIMITGDMRVKIGGKASCSYVLYISIAGKCLLYIGIYSRHILYYAIILNC